MNNKSLIAANIEEAKEELENMLANLANSPDYSVAEFKVSIEHAYHHLNFAWHIRNENANRVKACSPDDFKAWSKYPNGEIFEYGQECPNQ